MQSQRTSARPQYNFIDHTIQYNQKPTSMEQTSIIQEMFPTQTLPFNRMATRVVSYERDMAIIQSHESPVSFSQAISLSMHPTTSFFVSNGRRINLNEDRFEDAFEDDYLLSSNRGKRKDVPAKVVLQKQYPNQTKCSLSSRNPSPDAPSELDPLSQLASAAAQVATSGDPAGSDKSHNDQSQDSSSSSSIHTVGSNDVLCGRGGLTNHHPGNVCFRGLVRKFQPDYLRASKRDKAGIAHKIVAIIRDLSPSGRFLKKDPNNPNEWIDIGDRKAREKTSQALREGAPNLRDMGENKSLISPTTKERSLPDDPNHRQPIKRKFDDIPGSCGLQTSRTENYVRSSPHRGPRLKFLKSKIMNCV